MTAKQKANQARFKKVVAEAKKLRKNNCKLTQAQAVKQAWAIYKAKEEKNPINRIKKYIDEQKEGFKRGYYGDEYKKKRKKVGAMPTKVKAKKGKRTNDMHTDTKSHNVNIRVISGIEKVSKGAQKLFQEINKKGFFKFNSEENILSFLYDEAIRKGQYKKASYLKELLSDVRYY
jgi:hypothetical protein